MEIHAKVTVETNRQEAPRFTRDEKTVSRLRIERPDRVRKQLV